MLNFIVKEKCCGMNFLGFRPLRARYEVIRTMRL